MNHPDTNRIVLYDSFENRWIAFRSPKQIIRTASLEEVKPLLALINKKVEQERLYAAGFISYDASPAFDEALKSHRKAGFPLLWFGLYEEPEVIPLPRPDQDTADPVWKPASDRKSYDQGIGKVKESLRQGKTYQVNYTYRLQCRYEGSPWQLFLRMQAAQKARYGAFADIPGWAVCSASPELFFTLQGSTITTRPMKGTVPRGMTPDADRKQAQWLRDSDKNIAENRMIVDLIRNDLGRIAVPGSVRVPALFALEKYPTLWQMVTQVEAETEKSIPQIFEALFPCASITGAPKYSTMQIIKELENTARGLYTGSIGYMAPGRRAQFNVAIRTVVIDTQSKEAEYGTGGGIVWDSTPAEEWDETVTKAQVLNRRMPDFSLLESLKWSPHEGYFLLDRHLDRMAQSAGYFDFPFDRDKAQSLLIRRASSLPKRIWKIRLLLDQSGDMTCEEGETRGKPEWTLALAKEPVETSQLFLYHKTTHREIYRRMQSLCPGYDDVLLWNERREVTESCIANVVVTLNGRDYTPPVESGLLAGTFRSELLSSGELSERIITLEDLKKAERIILINSVRGFQEVRFSAPWT